MQLSRRMLHVSSVAYSSATFVRGRVMQKPPSPCKAICTLNQSAGVCTGCGRTVQEFAEWGSATASRQHGIVRQSSARLGRQASKQT
jgi:uncharacterized protein